MSLSRCLFNSFIHSFRPIFNLGGGRPHGDEMSLSRCFRFMRRKDVLEDDAVLPADRDHSQRSIFR